MVKKRHRKRMTLRSAALLMALFIALPFLLPTHAVMAAQSLQNIQKELADVRSKRNQLADQKTKLSGELAYLESRSKAQRAVYEDALEQKEAALMVLEMNQEAADIAQADYEAKLVQYEERVAMMYAWNRLSLIELLLSSESLQGFFTTLRFMKVVTDADEQALHDLEEASILASQLKEEAEDQYSEMIALVEQADRAMEDIKEQVSVAEQELKDIAASLEITRQKEAQLAREQQALTAPPPSTPSTPGAANTGWVGTHMFRWPLPDHSNVTSVFGWRAKYGRYHYGTDVAAPVGSRIVAMADGVVTYVGWPGTAYHWAYGKMIVINHDNGYHTRYGHLNGFNSYIGQRVTAGQVVGYTGNTGRSSGPHLHFEIRVNGVPKDPLNYFRRR